MYCSKTILKQEKQRNSGITGLFMYSDHQLLCKLHSWYSETIDKIGY